MKSASLNKKSRQLQWEIEQQHLITGRIESVRRETEQIFNIAVPLCVIDTNCRILRVNDTFCDLFGFERTSVVGRVCHTIWKNNLCNSRNCPMSYVKMSAKPSYTTEGTVQSRNGKQLICMITAKPFFSKENELIGIVENFIDITLRKEMEEELERTKLELLDQNLLLERKNSALRELMEQIRTDKKQTEERILDNVEHLVRPIIEKLKDCCCEKESTFIQMIETNLSEITSPFGSTIARNMLKLSSKEITIANMIKNGCDSKEIANLLHLSLKTVETHRKNIRRKLGITKSHENLYTCLTSIV